MRVNHIKVHTIYHRPEKLSNSLRVLKFLVVQFSQKDNNIEIKIIFIYNMIIFYMMGGRKLV
jgi:hypothetical protein